jgi:carbamoyltransferase
MYLGISAGFHDAAISVIDKEGEIKFAGHSERYSKIKHDKNLHVDLVEDALSYTDEKFSVHYYENPVMKTLRQIRTGEDFELSNFSVKKMIGNDVYKILGNPKVNTYSHHLSHAAAGFQTSNFQDATIVVIDAIGEFETITIWDATYINEIATYKKLYSKKYPNSIGLFYSAVTKQVGLKPLDEEYILMGMAAYGKPKYTLKLQNLFSNMYELEAAENLHLGLPENFFRYENIMDIASSAQHVVEKLINNVLSKARLLGKSRNLVYGGGVALNCLANRNLGDFFDNIWIMPNPGDAGSSLGSACLGYGKKVNWNNAFLGHEISGKYPTNSIIDVLLNEKIVGVANGRAEFGPRALGNRSLLADPRGDSIKDMVNEIKRRQKFRPFAPVILEEYAHKYFNMPKNWDNSHYMQVVAECKQPELFPAIVHQDNTSRVQTVPNDGSGIRELLEKWFLLTECPMLLNTSLNIRGEPMVNNRLDANRFENLYNVKVLS